MEFAGSGRPTAPNNGGHRPPPPHGGGALPLQGDVAALPRREALMWELHKESIRQEMILHELAEMRRSMAPRFAAGHRPRPNPLFPLNGWLSTPTAAREDAWRGRPSMPPWEEGTPFRSPGSTSAVRVPVYPHVEPPPPPPPPLSPPPPPPPPPADDAEQQERGRSSGSAARVHSAHPDADQCQLLCSKAPAVEEALVPTAANANVGPTEPKLFGDEVTPQRQEAGGQECTAGAEDGRAVQLLKEDGNQSGEQPKPAESIITGRPIGEPVQLPHQYGPAGQENFSIDEQKKLALDELKPKMLSSGLKRSLNAATSPAKKQKQLGEWSYPICNANTVERNGEPWEEDKFSEKNVIKPAEKCEKPPLEWNCNVCDTECHSESNFQDHLRVNRHRENMETNHAQGKDDEEMDMGRTPEESQKPPLKWSCNVCDTKCNSESNFQDHLRGNRHRENIESQRAQGKDEEAVNIGQVAEDKSLLEWICNICDAKCNSARNFLDHLRGNRHRENMEAQRAQCKDDEEVDMGRIPEESKKPPLKWSCNVCNAKCNSESNFQEHLRGNRHRENMKALFSQGKDEEEMDLGRLPKKSHKPLFINWTCSVCDAKCYSESDRQGHLNGRRHRENMEALGAQGKKEEKANVGCLPEKSQKPPLKWICYVCNAKCTSESNFQDHLRGNRHRENTEAQRAQCKDEEEVDVGRLPEESHKPPFSDWTCSDCDVRCSSESNFLEHLWGKRHRQYVQAVCAQRNGEQDSRRASGRAMSSKRGLHFCEDCRVQCSSEKMLASHLGGRRHRETLQRRH